jgi:hypothetical protein
VIIVDQKTSEIEEACRVLKYQPDIVEFQTFVREDAPDVHAYLFEPLHVTERVAEKSRKGVEGKRPLPKHRSIDRAIVVKK